MVNVNKSGVAASSLTINHLSLTIKFRTQVYPSLSALPRRELRCFCSPGIIGSVVGVRRWYTKNGRKLRVYHEIGCFPPRRGTRPSPGQAVLRAALGIDVPTKFSRPNGARENCCAVSCPFRAAKWFGCLETQGGGEYALPWARSDAPSGRKNYLNKRRVDTIALWERPNRNSL